jgi:hypothetical protein
MFCIGICAFAIVSVKALGRTVTELSLMKPLTCQKVEMGLYLAVMVKIELLDFILQLDCVRRRKFVVQVINLQPRLEEL